MYSIWQPASWCGNIDISMIQHSEKLDTDDNSIVSANLNNSEPGCSSPQDEGKNFHRLEVVACSRFINEKFVLICVNDINLDLYIIMIIRDCCVSKYFCIFSDMFDQYRPTSRLLTCGSRRLGGSKRGCEARALFWLRLIEKICVNFNECYDAYIFRWFSSIFEVRDFFYQNCVVFLFIQQSADLCLLKINLTQSERGQHFSS